MPLPNRHVQGNYRYGYQGEYAETDPETYMPAFELRLYDPRINRWIAPDPHKEFSSPYLAMGNNWINKIDPDGGSTASPDDDYKLIDGVVTFWKANDGPDRLFNADGTEVIGTANYGVLKQLDGVNILNKDFNLLTFNNKADFHSFLDFTADLHKHFNAEVGGLFFSKDGNPVSNVDDLNTKNYDLLLAGMGWAERNELGLGSTTFLLGIIDNYNYDTQQYTIKTQVYQVAAIYHTHTMTPAPSGGLTPNPWSDVGAFYTHNLNGVIQGLRGSRGFYNSKGNGFWDISGSRVNYKH